LRITAKDSSCWVGRSLLDESQSWYKQHRFTSQRKIYASGDPLSLDSDSSNQKNLEEGELRAVNDRLNRFRVTAESFLEFDFSLKAQKNVVNNKERSASGVSKVYIGRKDRKEVL